MLPNESAKDRRPIRVGRNARKTCRWGLSCGHAHCLWHKTAWKAKTPSAFFAGTSFSC